MKKILFLSGLFILIGFYSCKPLNPSIMLKTPKDFVYDTPPEISDIEYRIAPNDILSFRLYTNDGFRLIDFTTSSGGSNNNQAMMQNNAMFSYLVEHDGYCNLPILGRILLSNMTIREAELLLEDKYAELYIDPFVLLDITNRRVTIFPGSEGTGKVITLNNNNTTLIEAIAQAGGLASRGKAYKIKLFRGSLKDPKVYLIDLSTIEGARKADLILQANDIIYVEPIGITTRQIISEASPIVSVISSLITLYIVITNLN